MAEIRTLVGQLAYVEPNQTGAILAVRSPERFPGSLYREIRLNFTPRLTIAYHNQQAISLEQLRMGQVVEVLAGYFEEEPKKVFVMAITVKD